MLRMPSVQSPDSTIPGRSVNRPISQIPECIRQISHNATFCNRNVHTCAHFCYKMLYCGIWHRCILGFVRWAYTTGLYYECLCVQCTLKHKICHDANFVVTGDAGGCHYMIPIVPSLPASEVDNHNENQRCSQWRQSSHHDNSQVSQYARGIMGSFQEIMVPVCPRRWPWTMHLCCVPRQPCQ